MTKSNTLLESTILEAFQSKPIKNPDDVISNQSEGNNKQTFVTPTKEEFLRLVFSFVSTERLAMSSQCRELEN